MSKTSDKNKITPPGKTGEALYDDVLENGASYVDVRGRKWKVRWKRRRGLRAMSHILSASKDDSKVICQCTAALRLEKWLKLKLFYPFLWRWYYYVRDYQPGELLPYISECKKKVPLASYYACIMLLIGMRDTEMMMTREEVSHIRLEQAMERHGA